jgi:hypothetical protein
MNEEVRMDSIPHSHMLNHCPVGSDMTCIMEHIDTASKDIDKEEQGLIQIGATVIQCLPLGKFYVHHLRFRD